MSLLERNSFTFEASKIDWLRERPDKFKETDEGQRLLGWMEKHPEHDAIFPYLWTHARKGNLTVGHNGEPWDKKHHIGIDREGVKGYADAYHKEYGAIAHPFQMPVDSFLDKHAEVGDAEQPGSGNLAYNTMVRELGEQAGGQVNGRQFDFIKHHEEPGEPITGDKLDKWHGYIADKNHPLRQGIQTDSLKPSELGRNAEDWHFAKNNGDVVHNYNNGWTVRQLKDGPTAKFEGDAMGSCLGSYGHEIEKGGTNVFSLRDKHNQPHASFEITPADQYSEGPGEVVQIQGKENKPPIEKYQKMLKHYFLNHYDDHERPSWQDQSVKELAELPGYDPRDEGYTQYHEGDYGIGKPRTDTDYESLMREAGDSHRPEDAIDPLVNHAHKQGDLNELERAADDHYDFERANSDDYNRDDIYSAEEHYNYDYPRPSEEDYDTEDENGEYNYDENAYNKAKDEWKEKFEDWFDKHNEMRTDNAWEAHPFNEFHSQLTGAISRKRRQAKREELEAKQGFDPNAVSSMSSAEDARRVYMQALQAQKIPELADHTQQLDLKGGRARALGMLQDHLDAHQHPETGEYTNEVQPWFPTPQEPSEPTTGPVTAAQWMPQTASWDDEYGEDNWEDDIPDSYLQQQSEIRPWVKGQNGKGLIDDDGRLHTWGTNAYGEPHHDEYAQDKNVRYKAKVDVLPSGAATIMSPDESNLFGMDRHEAEDHLQREAPTHGLRAVRDFLSRRDPRYAQWEGFRIEPEAQANTHRADGFPILRVGKGQETPVRGLGASNGPAAPGGWTLSAIEDVSAHESHSVARTVTADKLNDFLMSPKNRPDLQTPEAQEFLGTLKDRYHSDKTDKLTPWLTREWKKGRLLHKPENKVIGYDGRTLEPPRLDHWADWLNSNHPSAKGDIMQKKIHDVHQHVQDWDDEMREKAHQEALTGAQTVHRYPDNWSLQKLTNEEQCKAEGDAMGHCAGGYGSQVEDGSTQIYSLRDHKGAPHATFEIQPKRLPPDEKPDLESMVRNNSALRNMYDHPDAQEAMDNLRNIHETGENLPGAEFDHKPLYDTLVKQHKQKDSYHQGPEGGDLIQVQGKGNEEPKDEYKERIKQYFHTIPAADRPANREGGGRHDNNEGYWIDELRNPDDIEPQDFHTGAEDAYGLPAASLPADYHDLLKNVETLYHGSYNTHNTDHVQSIYDLAKARGEIPDLGQAAERNQGAHQENFDDWMNQNHEYLEHPYDPDSWDEMGPDEAAEAEKAYDYEQGQMAEEHPGMAASNQIYSLLNQHAHDGTNYTNELKPTTFT